MAEIASILFSAFIVFAVSWWLILFILLPIGISDQPPRQEAGHDSGAPAKPNLRKKFRYATIAALIVSLIISVVVENDIIPLEEWLGVTGWEFSQ